MTQVQRWDKTAQTDHVTLRPSPLTLKVMAPVADAGLSFSIHILILKFVGLAVRKIWRTMCVSINGLVTLTIDLLSLKLVYESHQIWAR